MLLGEILVAHGLIQPADLEAAFDRQREYGGRLGDNLVALDLITADQLEGLLHQSPDVPKTIEEVGISEANLLKLLLKAMYFGGHETASEVAAVMKLTYNIVSNLLEEAANRKHLEILGSVSSSAVAEFRYSLTEGGKAAAAEALSQNRYVGPTPVSLSSFQNQIELQRITNERIDQTMIEAGLSGLVVSDSMVRHLGPGINSGRAMLLYGPPGNGKSSIATVIGNIFRDAIYVPYCVEVEGQIMKVYDPSVHIEAAELKDSSIRISSLRREEVDGRWVACRRPLIITGGELTLEMLDLSFNRDSMFYEAPLHVKALGGTFIIDDFGRQLVSPKALLNRWIVPLENRKDFLKLHTGKSFSIPFDELVIFSTNMTPEDLMDAAFLRRIPYKMELVGPTREEFRQIFDIVARNARMDLDDSVVELVFDELLVKNDFPLACYQPKFIVDQVVSACKYEGVPPQFTEDAVRNAMANLFTKDAPGRRQPPTTTSPAGNGAGRHVPPATSLPSSDEVPAR